MAKFHPSDLKAWRKRFHLAQSDFAKLAGVSLNTIGNIEAGAHKIQEATRIKISRAMKTFEAGKATEPEVSENESGVVEATPLVQQSTSPTTDIPTASPSPTDHSRDLVLLSNLDIELINRILQMAPKEKLALLRSLME